MRVRRPDFILLNFNRGKLVEVLCFGDAHVFVGAAVIKEPALASVHHAFHEDYIRNLADFFPLLLRLKDRGIGAGQHFAGIMLVEQHPAGAVNQVIVSAVVYKEYAVVGDDRRRAGLDHAGIELARAARQHGLREGIGPMEQIGGPCQAHLVGVVGLGAQVVHPPFAGNLARDDGAGLGPLHIPFSFVGGQENATALPVNEVAGGGEAQLGVMLVVAGVGEVPEAVNLEQARVFDAAILFVVCFGNENRLGAAGEVYAVAAG